MSGTTWGKFYWSDYASDEALKMCGLSTQGLWMRMLCTMAASDPYGYLTINGHNLNNGDLAKLYAVTLAEVDDAVAELDRYGVFSRDAKGRIYSRRMVRDAKKAAVARKNGKQGGNPSLGKQRRISPSDKGEDKATLKPHIPEARSQKPEVVVTKPTEDRSTDDIDATELQGQLVKAAGDCLHRTSPQLEMVSDALSWLSNGCDLKLDILPTLKATGVRRPPASVRSWSYFTEAVHEARDRRKGKGRESKPQAKSFDVTDLRQRYGGAA